MINKKSILSFMLGGAFWLLICIGGLYLYMQQQMSSFQNPGSGASIYPPPKFPHTGQVALNYDLVDMQGNKLNLASLARNKILFLNFWATWCPPCVKEMPSIQKLNDMNIDNLVIVCASNEPLDTLKAFVKKHKVTIPIYHINSLPDPPLRTTGIPSTHIIDPNGQLVFQHVGGADWAHDSVVDYLKKQTAKSL